MKKDENMKRKAYGTHNDKGIRCAMAELLNIEDVDNNNVDNNCLNTLINPTQYNTMALNNHVIMITSMTYH